MSISILILTFNEEKNLPACLKAIAWCDDIVVVDSFSDDRTVEIAENLGVHVYQRQFDNFASQRNFALANCKFKHEWVFHLDADEIITDELKSEMEREIENAKVDLDSTRNMAEVEEIMKKIHDIILKDRESGAKKPTSIGVVSPFRGQVELIKKAVYQVLTGEIIRKHDIEVGTAHTFQGDERDVMLLSLTIAPNSHHQSIMFAQKPNLFNVAITRARKKLIAYISRPVESLPAGLIRNYLEYIREVNNSKTLDCRVGSSSLLAMTGNTGT